MFGPQRSVLAPGQWPGGLLYGRPTTIAVRNHARPPATRWGLRLESSGSRAFGFTLLELVLAMAVMATIAAIAWPHLQPGVSRAEYRSAALQLKSDLAEARESAIHEGRVQELRFKPGTSRYAIAAAQQHHNVDAKAKPKSQRPGRDRIAAASSGKVKDESAEAFRELPGEIVFQQPRSEVPSRRTAGAPSTSTEDRSRSSGQPTPKPLLESKPDQLEDVLNPDNHEWVLSIRFFPDGRATEGDIVLEGADESREISVRVRGLTGGVSIGPVEAIDDDEFPPARSTASETVQQSSQP